MFPFFLMSVFVIFSKVQKKKVDDWLACDFVRQQGKKSPQLVLSESFIQAVGEKNSQYINYPKMIHQVWTFFTLAWFATLIQRTTISQAAPLSDEIER